ncbi:IS21 family transposase [Acidithrix sp. C25]|uniref:IS21 family transposase n=1 Tax=Acidithrix sp. C25 TaxID=1671482 RepID=UPI00191BCAFE|nr:IS21 family transposase [Acidithrix sp. C25]CAG4909071.1 unnamed protein product [Acidithrix sp. C25]CAG4909296.1 unnamed protein product [Acidithrix sp. C25]
MIDGFVKDGLISAPAILSRIEPLGYSSKETTIRNYVKSIKPNIRPHAKATIRYESKPGAQIQLDWGLFGYDDHRGTRRNIAGLMVTMGYSRRVYLEFALTADIYGFSTCLINALYYFGGITDAFLTDHMKTVVLGGSTTQGWDLNSHTSDLAKYLGISIKLAPVRRPQTKGKVERGIRYAKDNFWPARTFTNLADLNEQALSWCQQTDTRVHNGLGETPLEAFANESPYLRPLPKRSELYQFERQFRKVGADGFFSFAGVRYGVPWRFSHRVVSVIVENNALLVFLDEELIATHALSYKKRSMVYLPEQYKGIERHGSFIGPVPIARQYVDTQVQQRSLGVYEEVSLNA